MKKCSTAAEDEAGHIAVLLGALLGAAGAIGLSIGAANDKDWLIIGGGIVLAVGILAANSLRHLTIDYELFRRTDPKRRPEP